MHKGIKKQGLNILTTWFSNDIAILAEKEKDLKDILNEREIVFRTKYFMRLIKKKTKTKMYKTTKTHCKTVKVDGQVIERVEEFSYFGNRITMNGRCTVDINSRIAFDEKWDLLCSNNINI